MNCLAIQKSHAVQVYALHNEYSGLLNHGFFLLSSFFSLCVLCAISTLLNTSLSGLKYSHAPSYSYPARTP